MAASGTWTLEVHTLPIVLYQLSAGLLNTDYTFFDDVRRLGRCICQVLCYIAHGTKFAAKPRTHLLFLTFILGFAEEEEIP